MVEKKPNPIDLHVGSRVRLRRMLIGMSQEKLGDSMELTFQQIQKYEKGVNRIGASRLYQLAQVLEVPVQFFFEGTSLGDDAAGTPYAAPEAEAFIFEFLNSREGLELNRAFVKISDAKVRRSIIELVRTVGAQISAAEAPPDKG